MSLLESSTSINFYLRRPC